MIAIRCPSLPTAHLSVAGLVCTTAAADVENLLLPGGTLRDRVVIMSVIGHRFFGYPDPAVLCNSLLIKGG